MKSIKLLVIIVLFFALNGRGQTCPNVNDITLTGVCGSYGDANGNSFWNWELIDPLSPIYCNNWYARTSSTGNLTRMGSPFVNPGNGKLKIIADNLDYTKSKGWELLQRKFGCFSDIGNPYFVLYNRYTGMLRVYVYLSNNSSNYTQMLMTIKNVYTIRPANLSTANEYMLTPDKYLNNQAGSNDDEVLISLNESVGGNNWAVSEFNVMFDHNIENSLFANGSIEVTVYGVVNNQLKAVIQGTSIASPNAQQIKDGVVKAKNIPTGAQTFNFVAVGEKLEKFSKDINDFTNNVYSNSNKLALKLENSNDKLYSRIGGAARFVANEVAPGSSLSNALGAAADFLGITGAVLKFAGAISGFFLSSSGTPAPSPTYTSYNLNVGGTITANLVVSKFVIKLPGTSSPATNSNNATYYNISFGIFNLKTTPLLDTLDYDRRAFIPLIKDAGYENYPSKTPKTIKYTAYRLKNNIEAVVNQSSGLKLVSIDGAIVAKVEIRPEDNTAIFPDIVLNPLEKNPIAYNNEYFNHMRADIEANRIEVTHYDADDKGYHIIQTPFYKLQCLKNASININRNVFKVFLRIRAVFQKLDGTGKYFYFVKDYKTDKIKGNETDIPSKVSLRLDALPPYANYTIAPNTASKTVLPSGIITWEYHDITLAENSDENFTYFYNLKMNNTITNSINYKTIITANGNPSAPVTFRAGSNITFVPGFHAKEGCDFLATTDFGNTQNPCATTNGVSVYNFPGNFYNANVVAQRNIELVDVGDTKTISDRKKVYPNPSNNDLFVPCELRLVKNIRILDALGRNYIVPYKQIDAAYIHLDVSSLSNGTFFIVILDAQKSCNFQFVIAR